LTGSLEFSNPKSYSIFSLTALFSERLRGIKKGKTGAKPDFSLSVAAAGIEPTSKV
jgi:hypothetical protein